MTHVTCRLTAKNRDQLRNGNRVWATFTLFTCRQPDTLIELWISRRKMQWMQFVVSTSRPQRLFYRVKLAPSCAVTNDCRSNNGVNGLNLAISVTSRLRSVAACARHTALAVPGFYLSTAAAALLPLHEPACPASVIIKWTEWIS